MIPLIIMAAPRPIPNWHSTIATAVRAGFVGPIVVMLDGEVSPVERELYAHLDVTIFHGERGSTNPRLSACHNAERCFRLASSFKAERVSVVEDDVTFAPGWLGAVRGVYDLETDPIVLGYCREEMPPAVFGHGDVLERHATWDATLLVALSPRRAREAADALGRNLERSDPLPADNALSLHWRKSRTQVLTLNPSVVQHLGDVALVNPGDGVRRAPSWTGRVGR